MKAHEFWAWAAFVSMGMCMLTGYRYFKRPKRRAASAAAAAARKVEKAAEKAAEKAEEKAAEI